MTKLFEAVPEHLQDKASYWNHGGEIDSDTRDHIDSALGGKHHTIIDLEHTAHDVDPDVEEHLDKHGYKIHDYHAGTASIEKMVGAPDKGIPMQKKVIKESIGKVLQKTNASDSVKNAYANDPARTASKSTGLKILISNHPNAIIGKTSGTKWENESCMNAETGSNKHYLRADAEHMTHEAFLVHPHDECVTKDRAWPENPIARISIKRFDNNEGHTIYRPETSAYGAASSAFHAAVGEWASKAHPAESGQTYHMHDDLYHDSETEHHELDDDAVKALHHSGNGGKYTLSPNHLHLAIDSAIESAPNGKISDEIVSRLSGNIQNLRGIHLNKIINNSENPNQSAHQLAIRHGNKLSSSGIERVRSHLASIGKTQLPALVLKNKKLPQEAIDNLDVDQFEGVPTERMKPHHMDRLVDHYVSDNVNGNTMAAVNTHKEKLTSDHITKILGKSYTNVYGAKFPSFTKNGVPSAVFTDKFTPEHAEMISDHWHNITPANQKTILQKAPHITNYMLQGSNATQTFHNMNTAMGNKNLSDSHKGLIANEMVIHAENTPDQRGGYQARAFPIEGDSKHFTDGQVDRLAERGVRKANDYHLSKRLVDAHIKIAHAAADDFMEKKSEMEENGDDADFDNPEYEKLHNETADKIDDAYKAAVAHAETHGSDDDADEHEEEFRKISNNTDWEHDAKDTARAVGDDTIKDALQKHHDEHGHNNDWD